MFAKLLISPPLLAKNNVKRGVLERQAALTALPECAITETHQG